MMFGKRPKSLIELIQGKYNNKNNNMSFSVCKNIIFGLFHTLTSFFRIEFDDIDYSLS